MLYDWYVFDLDGTLTESDAGIIGCAERAIEKLGYPKLPAETMRKFIGPPLKWSFTELAGMDEERAMRAIEIYRERYFDIGWRENRVYPGAAQLVRAIKRAGGRVLLASSKPQVLCEMILKHFGLAPFFDKVVAIGLNDHDSDKTRLINAALSECADKSRAVMIGDRVYDRDGARGAGVDFIGVTYGYGAESEFSGARFIAKTPVDIADFADIPLPRGRFVSFEGVDGCGKTTQYSLAVKYLAERGWDMVSSREPGGCRISEIIRNLVLDKEYSEMTEVCEALLYAAARAQHVREVVSPALAAGKLVLCDRFLDSSVAYQGAGRELNGDFIRQINEPAVDGLKPDLTIYFSCDPALASARQTGAPDRLESADDGFKARVARGYEDIAAREPERVARVDCAGDIETVFAQTRAALDRLLANA